MKNIMRKTIIYIPLAICLLLFFYFMITSMNATVFLSEYEKRFYCKDYPLTHIFVAGLIISAIAYIRTQPNLKKPKNTFKQRIIIISILVIYGVAMVLLCSHLQLLPIFDQNKVYQIAAQLVNHDYTAFLKGGYGEKWTNQWGYLLLLMAEYKLFGLKNLNAIYGINIVFLIGIVIVLYRFSKKYLKSDSVSVLVCGCLFIPLVSYATFVYGNVPSWFFCLLAFDLLFGFLEKHSVLRGLAGALSIVTAVMLKTTSLIFFIAYVLYGLIRTFFDENKSKIIFLRLVVIGLTIPLYILAGKSIHSTMEHMTGMALGNGVPRIAHIAMSMHENGNGSGWYDGYIDTVYEENGYDEVLTRQAASADLNESIQQFKSNPIGAIGFFSRKVLSQWIEPTYESIFILLNRNTFSANRQYAANDLQINRLGQILSFFMNLMQSLMYIGTFLFYLSLAYEIKKNYKQIETDTLNKLVPGIIAIGGFLFYVFWEANSQYAIFFVLFFIPTAVLGFSQIGQLVSDSIKQKKIAIPKSQMIALVSTVILPILVSFAPETSTIGRLLTPRWSTEEYQQFADDLRSSGVKKSEYIPIMDEITAKNIDNEGRARFPAGRYLISLGSDTQRYLVAEGIEVGANVNVGNHSDNRIILTSTEKGYQFRFQETQNVMDVEMGATSPGTRVQQWESNGDSSQTFQFNPCEEGLFWITYADGLVLTAHNDNTVSVERKEPNDPLQLWQVSTE